MKKNNKPEIISKFLIKTSNQVARALTNKKLSKNEEKLFWFSLNKIGQIYFEEKEIPQKIYLNINEFTNFFGINKNYLYSVGKLGITNLIKNISNIKGFSFIVESLENGKGKKGDTISVFIDGGYENGLIYFILNPSVILNHFLELQKEFILFYLPHFKNFKCNYSLTFYRYFKNKLFLNNFEYHWNINKFEKILHIPKSSGYFKNMNDLKKYVLEPVKTDLNQTDITMDYSIVKQGNKFTEIIFKIVRNYDLHKKIKPKAKGEIDNFTENSTKKKLEVNTMTPEQIKNILKELDAH